MISEKPNMVNAFIRNQKNYALLIHNIGWSGKDDRWEFPGGKAWEKNLEEKVCKEVFEELGIKIKLNGIFGDYETQTPEGDFLCRTFFAEIISREPRIIEKNMINLDILIIKDY